MSDQLALDFDGTKQRRFPDWILKRPEEIKAADSVRDFVLTWYKHDRLEGRNGTEYGKFGPGYSEHIIRSHERDFERYGYDTISHHDSKTGEPVTYCPAALEILRGDA